MSYELNIIRMLNEIAKERKEQEDFEKHLDNQVDQLTERFDKMVDVGEVLNRIKF